MPQVVTTAMSRRLLLPLGFALAVAIAPASLAQAAHDDLPPLQEAGSVAANTGAKVKTDGAGSPISVTDLQMLVPAAQLICWSHGASENPQGSHDIGEEEDRTNRHSPPGSSHPDPILTVTTPIPRDEIQTSGDDSSAPEEDTDG
jgi:hypothetical protein